MCVHDGGTERERERGSRDLMEEGDGGVSKWEEHSERERERRFRGRSGVKEVWVTGKRERDEHDA